MYFFTPCNHIFCIKTHMGGVLYLADSCKTLTHPKSSASKYVNNGQDARTPLDLVNKALTLPTPLKVVKYLVDPPYLKLGVLGLL